MLAFELIKNITNIPPIHTNVEIVIYIHGQKRYQAQSLCLSEIFFAGLSVIINTMLFSDCTVII